MAQEAKKPFEPAATPSASKPVRLTRNERLVIEALETTDGPVKAYELLAALKDQGVKAPMTVYRALDRLEAKGIVHKIDALNAFVRCNHEKPHRIQSFLICSQCNKAEELEEQLMPTVEWQDMRAFAANKGFAAKSSRVEIRGICAACA